MYPPPFPSLQVSPSELEDVICSLPEVVEVGVVGVAHERLGEAPFAFVVAKEKIAKEKVSQHWLFYAEIILNLIEIWGIKFNRNLWDKIN